MGTTQVDSDSEASQSNVEHEESGRIRSAIADSVLLKIAVSGVFVVLFGAFLDSGIAVPAGGLWGIWSAVFAVWGGGLILTGVFGFAFVWWRRNY